MKKEKSNAAKDSLELLLIVPELLEIESFDRLQLLMAALQQTSQNTRRCSGWTEASSAGMKEPKNGVASRW